MIIDGTQVCSPMTNADDTKLDVRTRIMLFALWCVFFCVVYDVKLMATSMLYLGGVSKLIFSL